MSAAFASWQPVSVHGRLAFSFSFIHKREVRVLRRLRNPEKLAFITIKGLYFTGEHIQWAKAHFFVGVSGIVRYGTKHGGEVPPDSMPVDVEKISEIAGRVATSEGMALIDVELKGGRSNPLLRIYIDKPQGVSHADCALVSEQMSAILDVEDLFPGSYTLEVSSPGLDRALTKPSHYQHFSGRRARLVLKEPVGEQRVIEGRLAGFESGKVRMDLGEGRSMELELANISKARLVLEL